MFDRSRVGCLTSQADLPLSNMQAQLEPVSSNGGRKITVFEAQNFEERGLFIFFF